MFKGTSDKLNYIDRVASHATKPRPSGRIDDIPAWAAEPEAYYNSVRDQYRSLADQLAKTQNILAEINEKLRISMPFKEYEHLRQHKERLAERIQMLQQQAASYREIARAAGEQSWAICFYLIGRKLLPPEDFAVLLKETETMLERKEFEIKKGQHMVSEEARESRRQHEHRRKRRANWHRHQGGTVTVWADNKPVTQKFKDEK